MKIHDLADSKNQMPRAGGSELIYNRQSHQSWFPGALTSDRFITILRFDLRQNPTPIVSVRDSSINNREVVVA